MIISTFYKIIIMFGILLAVFLIWFFINKYNTNISINIVKDAFETAYANKVEQVLQNSLFNSVISENNNSPIPIKYTFTGNFDDISDINTFTKDIINSISNALSLDQSNIEILKIYKGSVILSFIIKNKLTIDMLNTINSPQTFLKNTIDTYKLGDINNITFALPITTTPPTTTEVTDTPLTKTEVTDTPPTTTPTPVLTHKAEVTDTPPTTTEEIVNKVEDLGKLGVDTLIEIATSPTQLGGIAAQIAINELILRACSKNGTKAISKSIAKTAYKASSIALRSASKVLEKIGLKATAKLAILGSKAGTAAAKLAAEMAAKKLATKAAEKGVVMAAGASAGPAGWALDIFSYASMGLDILDVGGYNKMLTKKMLYDLKKTSDQSIQDVYNDLGVILPTIKGPDIDFDDVTKILTERMADPNDPIMMPMNKQMADEIANDFSSGALTINDLDSDKMDKYTSIIDSTKLMDDIVNKKCLEANGKIVSVIDPLSKYILKEKSIDLNNNIGSYNKMSLAFCEKKCADNINCKAFGYRKRRLLDSGLMDDDDEDVNCWIYDNNYNLKSAATGYDSYTKDKDIPDNMNICSYNLNKCDTSYSWPLKDGEDYVEYKKTSIDRNVNGSLKKIDEDLCVSTNSVMKTICDNNKTAYDPVSGICKIDDAYCRAYGADYLMNDDLKEYDCTIGATQDFLETIAGTTITRGIKKVDENIAQNLVDTYLTPQLTNQLATLTSGSPITSCQNNFTLTNGKCMYNNPDDNCRSYADPVYDKSTSTLKKQGIYGDCSVETSLCPTGFYISSDKKSCLNNKFGTKCTPRTDQSIFGVVYNTVDRDIVTGYKEQTYDQNLHCSVVSGNDCMDPADTKYTSRINNLPYCGKTFSWFNSSTVHDPYTNEDIQVVTPPPLVTPEDIYASSLPNLLTLPGYPISHSCSLDKECATGKCTDGVCVSTCTLM